MGRFIESSIFLVVFGSFAAAPILLSCGSALAFGGKNHNSFTTETLQDIGFSDAAAARIGKANQYIDGRESAAAPTHVDSESFEAASELMRTRLHSAAVHLAGGNITEAMDIFGYAIHTAQDFYAHSNYVEYMAGKPIDLLHLTNPAAGVTCSKSDKENGLTSGYYPDAAAPADKCSHKTLSKDRGFPPIKHFRALHYAKKETRHMFNMFKLELTALASGAKALALLDQFKGGNGAAGQPAALEGEPAPAALKVDGAPRKKGENVSVSFTAGQYFGDFLVDIVDETGKIVAVDALDRPIRTAGDAYLYKGPMDKDETRTMAFQTGGLAAGTYFLRAEYKDEASAGQGALLAKFLIAD